MPDPTRICMWSGPRNVSTALMYSFRQRPDTTVVDEPLYAHYLTTTGVTHPGVSDVAASQDNNGESVVREVVLGPSPTSVIFFKQMAHHLVGLDWGFVDKVSNFVLTREPRAVLASYIKQVDVVTPDSTGLPMCVRLVERIIDCGATPLVVDSKRLLLDPPGVLSRLCEGLGIGFDPAMLAWDPGPKPEDGVWAPHWYAATHASTGFSPYVERSVDLPEQVEAVAERCRPLYERLLEFAI